ncbi:MAG: S8 family serine peptidase [Pseudomonadota bacterium]
MVHWHTSTSTVQKTFKQVINTAEIHFEPANIDAPNAYAISAIDINDVFASFSNWGDPVDYAAPGVGVPSTRMGDGVITMSGTSMAAPHVCGILLHQAPPNTDGFAINDLDSDPDPIAHY